MVDSAPYRGTPEAATWFVCYDGIVNGPHTLSALARGVADGHLTSLSLVSRRQTPPFLPMTSFPELQTLFADYAQQAERLQAQDLEAIRPARAVELLGAVLLVLLVAPFVLLAVGFLTGQRSFVLAALVLFLLRRASRVWSRFRQR